MLIGHQKQWEFLKKKFEQNQLSHAYLFAGKNGIGKKLFAAEFAKLIGCKFPDLKIIEKKEDKSEIDISQIREAQNFLSYKSYNGGFKIVIIDNAELMNQEAQSRFLKTLEEPKGQTILFLISSKPDMMLETIVSRCQTMKFFKPKDLPENKEQVEKDEKILKELSAVLNSNFANKFKYVKSIDFEKQDAGEIVQVLQKYLRDRLLSSLRGAEATKQSDVIQKLKKNLELTEEINNKLLFTNVNPKLALEILLMEI